MNLLSSSETRARGATPPGVDREALLRTIEALERQRGVLGEAATELAIAPLRATLAMMEDQARERSSERKVVSVLFVDIAGFTEMSERLDSETVLDIVNGLFDRLVPIVERYGGTVDKFIGDEIMAVFGAPRAAEHHAEHALRAALDMFTALSGYNRDHGLSLGLHVGVNTGPVIAGAVGSHDRHDYSVTGDTVNVASRIEHAAASGQILVGGSTYRHTLQWFDFEPLDPIALKGKAQPLPVYRLCGEKRGRAVDLGGGLQLPFRGRRQELERLVTRATGDEPPSGRGVVGVVAEPGIGKSRVVFELRQQLGPTTGWIDASARDYRGDVSYGVVHDLLDAIVGVPEGADTEEAAAAYAAYLEGIGADRAERTRPYLLRLRGLPIDAASEATLAELPPDALRRRMSDGAIDLIAATMRGRAAVVCVEDLHWADPSSVSVLRALVEHSDLRNVLLVFTARPEPCAATQWIEELRKDADRASIIDLAPLSDAETSSLLDEAFSSPEWRALRDEIRAKAQGNPLYLVSFLRSLVDQGVAIVSGDRLAVQAGIAELAVPEDLQAVVGSRIDRLPSGAKNVLQWASVLGTSFSPHHVALLSQAEGSSARVDEALELLCRRQLLQPDAEGRLAFVHAVVRDVAYVQLLERDRRRLHSSAARFLEAETGPDSEADVARLAWHYERGGDRSRASERYEHAATLASVTHAHREQSSYLDAAIRLAQDDTTRILVLIERAGDVLHLLGRFGEAAQRFESLLAGTHPIDELHAARLHRKIARTFTPRWQFDPANRALDDARALLDRSAAIESPEWWREHFALELFRMWSYYMQARVAELVAIVPRLAPQVEQHATIGERGLFHRSLALLKLREQRFRPDAETVRLAAQAADELRTAGDLGEICAATFTHAFVELWNGALADAERDMRNVLHETIRLGDAERNLLCLVYLAVLARFRGDVDTTEAFANAAVAVARTNGAPHYEGASRANLAWVAWKRGDAPATKDHLGSARRLSLPNYPFAWMHAMVSLALAVEAMDLDAASEHARTMTAPHTQLLRADVDAALQSAVTAPSLDTMVSLVGVSKHAGYL